jgi:hypothetical protein
MNTPLLDAALWTIIATSAFAGPRITLQPSPAANVVRIGANLTNRITATTTNAPLSNQWMFNEVALPDASHETLILTNLQLSQAGSYRCTVTDLSGSTNSFATAPRLRGNRRCLAGCFYESAIDRRGARNLP